MKTDNQSSAAMMLRSLMGMVTIITLALGFLIVGAVGHQLLEQTSISSAHIITSLKKVQIDGNDDWESWRRNSTLDTSSSYVAVHNMRADAKVKYYYSPDAKKLLATNPLPLISNVYFSRGNGLYYRDSGHARGIRYTLWLSMATQLEVLERVVWVTLLLLALTLVLSPFYIRRLTHRLTDSLRTLSQTTKAIAHEDEPGTMKLPVPAKPSEVTELAQNFNELLAMLSKREEQQKLFVMNAAHELRTPIAAIRSHSQLIERRAADHPEIVPKSVHYITAESRQMQQLIDELLELSRADRLSLEMSTLDLSTTVRTIMDKLGGTLQHSLTLQIPDNITGYGNSAAIEQILSNLVTNAAKYSPDDNPINITLSAPDADRRLIAVSDTGSGIAPEDLPHVFERFYRSAEVRGSVPGTGLGLAIAAQLADMSNGNLQIKANQPHGTVVILQLPAR